jgi:hypothetical protein
MHQQTAKALKDRSEKAIPTLRHWAFHLSQEMRTARKAVLDTSGPDRFSKYVDDPHPETITLKWADVDNLVQVLRTIANDFSNSRSSQAQGIFQDETRLVVRLLPWNAPFAITNLAARWKYALPLLRWLFDDFNAGAITSFAFDFVCQGVSPQIDRRL